LLYQTYLYLFRNYYNIKRNKKVAVMHKVLDLLGLLVSAVSMLLLIF
jgi:hypothetical protein